MEGRPSVPEDSGDHHIVDHHPAEGLHGGLGLHVAGPDGNAERHQGDAEAADHHGPGAWQVRAEQQLRDK
jgi:hypothetical protein